MSHLKNFTAVDWREGPDRIYFFFKDSNTYSRFDIGANHVDRNVYPSPITGDWGSFDKHAKNLRFGFTTTAIDWSGIAGDQLWLFYDDGGTPMVCKYSQRTHEVHSHIPVSKSIWAPLTPYFDRIVGVMWREDIGYKELFWVLLNDGNYITFNYVTKKLNVLPLLGSPWSNIHKYKDRIITAVLNDHSLTNSYFYIFLTGNQYLRYNANNTNVTGPFPVNEGSWPGLLV